MAGIVISPRPSRGPPASQRMSLAIFIRSQASAFSAPWAATISSSEVSAWNLFSAVRKGIPLLSARISALRRSKPAGAFSPVPTAVPPSASSRSGSPAARISSASRSRLARQPEISWEKRIGTASCRCVLPHLRIPSFSFSNSRSVSVSSRSAGSTRSSRMEAAAICIAVGKVSFDDWLIFTSSLGCSTVLQAISFPRFAITSFTFMLLWVPLPVCHTTSGK